MRRERRTGKPLRGFHENRTERLMSVQFSVLARSPSSALYPFLGEGSPNKPQKKGTLILTSLLENLVNYELLEYFGNCP